MKYTYEQYEKSAKLIFKRLFPDLSRKANCRKARVINTDGVLDIRTGNILVSEIGVKGRFNDHWTEYWKDGNRMKAFELFIQSVFHYGYQQALDHKEAYLTERYEVDAELQRHVPRLLREERQFEAKLKKWIEDEIGDNEKWMKDYVNEPFEEDEKKMSGLSPSALQMQGRILGKLEVLDAIKLKYYESSDEDE